jgi:hypothetical protein
MKFKFFSILITCFFLIGCDEPEETILGRDCNPLNPDTCGDSYICTRTGTDGIFTCNELDSPFCGDKIVDEESGETCDATDFGSFTCTTGNLICSINCEASCSL